MKLIHICHIVQCGGGVETYILNLLRNCNRSMFRHTVINYTDGTLARTAKEAGAEVISIAMVREITPVKDLISFIKILCAVNRLKPDIIHAHSAKGGMFGRLCGTLLGIPVFFTPHAFSYLGQRGIRRFLALKVEKLLAYTPSLLVACSPSEAKRAIKEVGWHPKKVTTQYPNSIEVPDNKVEHLQKKNIKVLSIGRLCFQKNPEMLFRVANIVKDRNKSITFTILGAGYSDELGNRVINMMKDFNLADVVHIMLWSTPDTVKKELLDSDIYVSASRYESFGFTTAEAMVMGLPVVATNIDGSVDLVEDGKTGYLVNVGDDEKMASYICKLAADSELRERLGEYGRDRVKRFFNLKENIAAIERLYSSQYEVLNRVQNG